MDYSLFIDTPQALEEGLEVLTTNKIVETVSQRINGMGTLSHWGISPGLYVEGHYVIHADAQRPRLEFDHGLTPTLQFIFRIDEFVYEKAGHQTGITTMLRASSLLLNALAGDAVLLGPDFLLLLSRKKGSVALVTEGEFWNPFRISQIDLPHRLNRPVSIH